MKKVKTIPLRIDVIPIYNSFFLLAMIRLMSSIGLEPHEIIVKPMKMCDKLA